MTKLVEKRTVDMEIIGDWVEPNTRVLDLGCGPGVLLDYLVQTKKSPPSEWTSSLRKSPPVSAAVSRPIKAT